jgi:2-keto-4-pentenoate hydratase
VGNHQIAREVLVARRHHHMLVPPSRRFPKFSDDDGYAVGQLIHQDLVNAGWSPIGFKLGFTNQAIWGQLGLNRPFWAHIYDRTVTESRDVSLNGFLAPRIEPEIVVGIVSDVHADASSDEVSAAIGWAALGFEIVQCHFPHWEMRPADAIADAGLHGALVVGDRHPLTATTARGLSDVEVTLLRAGEIVARGRGSAALGGPVDAVVWLLSLPGVRGLQSGAIVTTGTLTAAFPVASGEMWGLGDTGLSGLGDLEVTFS